MKTITLFAMLIALAGHAKAGLIAGGTDDLSVTQTIVALGGGQWQYTFNVTSADPSPVWEFAIYTSFATTNGTASGFPHVAPTGLTSIAPADVATNIDPSLTTLTNMYYLPAGGPGGLATGGMADLIFDASVYDPSAKLYAYETVASGNVGNNNIPGTGALGSLEEVEAIGYTNSAVPEPATLLSVAIGLMGLALFRRVTP